MATSSSNNRQLTRRATAVLLALTTGVLLQACSEADLPQRNLQPDDCLRDVQLNRLHQALGRCDQVVARYPRDPAPRNERALLLSLNGQDQAACAEIEAAHALARQAKPGTVDPLLASEISMRRQSCQAGR